MTETFDKKPLLAKIHIAKKDLGLDDDMYRDLLFNITGERSAAKLTFNQLEEVLKKLKDYGFKAKKTYKPYLFKVRALWTELKDLKAFREENPSLDNFVKNIIGIDRTDWLKPKDAIKVIEALKSWVKRVKGGADDRQ